MLPTMSFARHPPRERAMSDVVGQAMDEFLHRRLPFVPHHQSLKYGSPIGEIVNNAEKYSFTVDLSHFHPDEIRVSINLFELTIEAKHDDKHDGHGTVARSFTRKYKLPEDINFKSVRSFFDKNGHLTIEIPKKIEELTQPRAVPIQMIFD